MTVDAIGGVWQYACELSAALRPLGIETVLALLGPPPSMAQRKDLYKDITLIETGLDLDWLAPDAAVVERAGSEIAMLATRLGADLVHLNQPALAASASFSVPVVTTIHSCVATWWRAVHGGAAPPPSFEWQTEFVLNGLRRSVVVAAPTTAFAEVVQHTYALRDLPSVVPNGRQMPPINDVQPVDSVFTAGRLWDKGKNVETLDRVAARIAHRFSAAGSLRGPHGETVAPRHIETLGALDSEALSTRLSKRPIFISAALYEPFGLAVLEAAGFGCALVLADIPTFREIWDGSALFFATSDEDGFVDAIDALLRDPEARACWGERARDRAAQFTPSRMATAMQAIYAHALAPGNAESTAA